MTRLRFRSARAWVWTMITLTSLGVLAWCGAQIVAQSSLGIDWDERGIVYTAENGLPVIVGDRVVAIDGAALSDTLFPYYNWQRGDVVAVTIVPVDGDGTAAQTVQLSLDKRSPWQVQLRFAAILLVAFFFWVSGALVQLFSRTPYRQGTLFFLSCMLIAVALAGGTATLSTWLTHSVRLCAWWAIATFTHFHLIFPRPKPINVRAATRFLYTVPVLGTIVSVLWALQLDGALVVGDFLDSLSIYFFDAWVLLGVIAIPASLGYAFQRSPTLADRRQVGLIYASCLMAFTPIFTLSLLPETLLGRAIVPVNTTFVALAFVALGYSYAIFQYRLLNFDRYIRRSTTIVLILGTLTVIYSGLTFLVSSILPTTAQDEPLFNLVAVIGLAALFDPLRRRLQKFSDTVLYGGWYDYSTVVGALADELDQARSSAEELAETFCATIQRAMRVHGVALLLPAHDADRYTMSSAGTLEVGPLLARLRPTAVPRLQAELATVLVPINTSTLRSKLEGDQLTSEEHELLNRRALQVWMPVRGRRDDVGFLVLGGKLGGDPFDEADMVILQAVIKQINVAYQNIQLIAELERRAADNARYKREVLRAREEERKRLAHELHDELIQQLVGLRYQLAGLNGTGRDAATGDDSVAQLQAEIAQLIKATRELCYDLRPPALDLGLIPSIRSVVGRFEKRSGTTVALTISGDRPQSIPEDVALCLFRCTSEALLNVWKHAGAREVTVRLAFRPTEIAWEVADDGRGFAVPEHIGSLMRENHYGLVGLRERIEMVEGTFQLASGIGDGTRLSATIPLRPTA